MRIALITTSWPSTPDDPSGHFVRAEASQLEQEGHTIALVAPKNPGAANSPFGWPGVAARIRERPVRALGAARWVLEACALVKTMRVDRVVAHWAWPCAWPIAASIPFAPLEVVSHGSDVRLLVTLPRPLRDRAVTTLAERAERWRFVSTALCERMMRTLGAPARARVERVCVIGPTPLGMPDLDAVRKAGSRLREALGKRTLAVSIGRLVTGKRVDRAIEYLARERTFDALLVIGDGPERRRLEHMAKKRQVDAHFTGRLPRAEALAWMAASHALLHGSESEGLSTVLREADALGVRVICLR